MFCENSQTSRPGREEAFLNTLRPFPRFALILQVYQSKLNFQLYLCRRFKVSTSPSESYKRLEKLASVALLPHNALPEAVVFIRQAYVTISATPAGPLRATNRKVLL